MALEVMVRAMVPVPAQATPPTRIRAGMLSRTVNPKATARSMRTTRMRSAAETPLLLRASQVLNLLSRTRRTSREVRSGRSTMGVRTLMDRTLRVRPANHNSQDINSRVSKV